MVQRNELQIRDPFVVPVPSEGRYYLFGTTDKDPWNKRGVGFDAYYSADLERFEGPFQVFTPPEGFWGTDDFWAPELHILNGRFYLLASFKSATRRRGTQILHADSILGPYVPLGNDALTSGDWECLDGTLFVDESGVPWMVYCHEWVQCNDGEIHAMPVLPDLSAPAGANRLLFRASDASWPRMLERRDGTGLRDARVTDGPFLHRQADGRLCLLWSSLGSQGYAMGCAISDTGSITGPWRQAETPVVARDGGHGMVFRDFSGTLRVAYHTPNQTPNERFVHFPVIETADGPVIAESAGEPTAPVSSTRSTNDAH